MTNSANVELVRSIFADWERGDYSSAEWADPEIEFVIADGPAPGNWFGLAGLAHGTRDFLSAWTDWRYVVAEYRELDHDRVLALVDYSGRGKTSGLDVGQLGSKAASVFHVREGRIVRLVFYLDRERAFADLGLDSEGDSSGTEQPR